jgi:hypothetical protein
MAPKLRWPHEALAEDDVGLRGDPRGRGGPSGRRANRGYLLFAVPCIVMVWMMARGIGGGSRGSGSAG